MALNAPSHELVRRFRHLLLIIARANRLELFAELFEFPQSLERQAHFLVERRCQNLLAQILISFQVLVEPRFLSANGVVVVVPFAHDLHPGAVIGEERFRHFLHFLAVRRRDHPIVDDVLVELCKPPPRRERRPRALVRQRHEPLV